MNTKEIYEITKELVRAIEFVDVRNYENKPRCPICLQETPQHTSWCMLKSTLDLINTFSEAYGSI